MAARPVDPRLVSHEAWAVLTQQREVVIILTADKSGAVVPFEKLPSKKKSEHVAEQILRSIRKGTYKVGDKLPAEYDIAQMTGVSRPAVREALGALRLLGILDSKTGSGTFIRSVVDQSEVHSLLASSRNPFEALEARAYIEPVAARLAMKAQHPAQMKRLGKDIQKMQDSNAKGDLEAVYMADRAFHRHIGEASGNALLSDFVNTLIAACLDSRLGMELRRAYLVEDAYRSQIMSVHERVCDCMVRQDLEGMEEAFGEHFRRVEKQLLGIGPADLAA